MGTGHEVPIRHFDESWEKLAQLDAHYDIIYVPLDRPEKYAQFAKVEKAIGATFDPRWEYHDGHIEDEHLLSNPVTVEKDIAWIYDLPMVRQYYG
jgi:hypothetical protein